MPNSPKLPRWTHWLKTWNEGPLALLLVALFIYSAQWLHHLDPSAGSFDLGILQTPLLAGALFFFSGFIAWNAFRLNFPALFREFNECLEDDLSTNQETSRTWRILVFSLFIYFGYLAAMGGFVLLVLFSVPR